LTVLHDPTIAAELVLTRVGRRRPEAVLLERVTARPWVAVAAWLPAFGIPSILAEIAGNLFAPPPAEVMRRV